MEMTSRAIAVAALGAAAQQAAAVGNYLGAPPPPIQDMACEIRELRAQFRPLAGDAATYTASGACNVLARGSGGNTKNNESTFASVDNSTVVARFTWTGRGDYDPKSRLATEELQAPPPTIDEGGQARRPYGRFLLTTLCDTDPWLNPRTARCDRPQTTYTGDLGAARRDLEYAGRPFTAYYATPTQTAALQAAYQRAVASVSVGNASSTLRAGAGIASPAAGALTSPRGGARTRVEGVRSTQVQVDDSAAPAPVDVATPTGGAGGSLPSGGAGGSTRPSDGVPTTTDVPTQRGSTSAAGTAAAASGAAAAAPATPPPTPTPPTATPPAATPPTATPPTPTPPAAAAAPRIVLPAVQSRVAAGQLRVQVVPAGSATPREAQVEFRWVSALPGHMAPPPERSPVQPVWTLPMQHLAQGAVVPPAVGPTKTGRWQVRVRAVGEPAAAWSAPVVFDFVANARVDARARAGDELARRGLNPQPLPPKQAQAKSLDRTREELERRGLNPQPLPPRSAFDRQQQY
jgi:hypothetical protein